MLTLTAEEIDLVQDTVSNQFKRKFNIINRENSFGSKHNTKTKNKKLEKMLTLPAGEIHFGQNVFTKMLILSAGEINFVQGNLRGDSLFPSVMITPGWININWLHKSSPLTAELDGCLDTIVWLFGCFGTVLRYRFPIYHISIPSSPTDSGRFSTTTHMLKLLRGTGARCSSVVRTFTHDAMGHRIDPSWWTHWVISSSQCPTTGVTKAVVCVILSVGWCI